MNRNDWSIINKSYVRLHYFNQSHHRTSTAKQRKPVATAGLRPASATSKTKCDQPGITIISNYINSMFINKNLKFMLFYTCNHVIKL